MMENDRQIKTNIWQEIKGDWITLLLVLASLAAGVAAYPQLPDLVPSHWNIKGQVDGYSSRFWGAFGIPLMLAGIYLLMLLMPRIDPKRANYSRFGGAYRTLKLAIALFFVWLYGTVLASAMGFRLPVDKMVITAVGILFMVIGNFMGQFRHNYFVGIRTPWTLANEEVWQKTHRLAARIWVAAGLAMAAAGLALGGQRGLVVIILAIVAAALVPIVYAYALHRKLS